MECGDLKNSATHGSPDKTGVLNGYRAEECITVLCERHRCLQFFVWGFNLDSY